MGILDSQLLFSDAQAITADAVGTNVIDLGAVRDIGKGQELWFYAFVQTTATSGGSATLTTALVTDDSASFGSATTLLTSAAIAVASLTAGTVLVKARIPSTTERYLRVNWIVATAALTAGNFSAFITTDVPNEGPTSSARFYPTSYTQG